MSANTDPRQSSSPPSHSTSTRPSSYFTYPISYAVSGVLRRLNTDPSPQTDANGSRSLDNHSNSIQSQLQSTASSLSQSFASLVSSSTNSASDMHSVFQPPHRMASPFQPPPLTPLTLKGYRPSTREKGRLLNKALAEEIRLLVPPRLQLVDEWSLAFSLEQNGVSLSTLYQKADDYRGKRGGYVLVVRDGSGCVFGAYLSDPPYPTSHFYGNGECFLWRAHVLTSLPDFANLPPPPSADTTHATRMTTIATSKPRDMLSPPASGKTSRSGTSTPERIRFKAFPYSGVNDYMIFCEHSYLSIGGG
jgi:hypothetical protein